MLSYSGGILPLEPQLVPASTVLRASRASALLSGQRARFLSSLQQPASGPPRGGSSPCKSGHSDWQKHPRPGDFCQPQRKQKGRTVAARTIPFPTSPGTAATSRVTPPPPPTSAAKLIPATRRYRGLYLVQGGQLHKVSENLNRLAQTQAIVAQVEREVAQRAQRERPSTDLTLLNPIAGSKPSLASRAAHRVVFSLFPAGL